MAQSRRSALFLIDLQRELLVDPKSRIPEAERLTANSEKILSVARAVIDSYRAKGAASPSTIVVVQHEEGVQEDGSGLVRDSQAWQAVFPAREGVVEESRVYKDKASTFASNPDLADRLRGERIGHIVTFGIQSECCVEATSKSALEEGFEVTVLSGAHSTYGGPNKSAGEIAAEVDERLQKLGAKIVPWDEAVATWEKEGRIC